MSIVNGDDFDRTLPVSNCSHVSGKKVLAPYVQQNEKCTFQLHIGENELGDDVQDFPHSLELGGECDKRKTVGIARRSKKVRPKRSQKIAHVGDG